MDRPLLLIDVDGVISLFGFDPAQPPAGRFAMVDGIAHLLSDTAGPHLERLGEVFDPVWCTGWEEKANEYLPHALGLASAFPYLRFAGATPAVDGHWKLQAIDEYAGSRRALAWIDDAHDERCRSWALERPGPTLLISTDPATGLMAEHVEQLLAWGRVLRSAGPGQSDPDSQAATTE